MFLCDMYMIWYGPEGQQGMDWKATVEGPEGQDGMDRKVNGVRLEGLLRLWDRKAPKTH